MHIYDYDLCSVRLPSDSLHTVTMPSSSRGLAEDSRGTNPVNALVSPPMQRVPQPGTTTGRIVMDGQTGNGPRRGSGRSAV